MDPRQALGYPHFVSLALVVAGRTLGAGLWVAAALLTGVPSVS